MLGSSGFSSSTNGNISAPNTASCVTAGIAGVAIRYKTGFELLQGGPGLTVARVALAAPGRVRLSVHDMRGREMALLADGYLPLGVYFFRVRVLAR